VIWTGRLRTGRVVTFLASGSRAFRAAASIAAAAVVDLGVIASAVAADLAATASVAAEDLGAVDLAGSADLAAADFAAAAGSGTDAEN
jgi:hypothetical protein